MAEKSTKGEGIKFSQTVGNVENINEFLRLCKQLTFKDILRYDTFPKEHPKMYSEQLPAKKETSDH